MLAQHTQLVQAAENLPSLLLAMPSTFGELMRLQSVDACRVDAASGAWPSRQHWRLAELCARNRGHNAQFECRQLRFNHNSLRYCHGV